MTQHDGSPGVRPWRRATEALVAVGVGALFVVFLYHLTVGYPIIENHHLTIGAAIIVGALTVGAGRIYLRQKSAALSDVLSVATEIVHLAPSRSDLRATAAVLLVVSLGLGFVLSGGQPNTKLQILAWVSLALCTSLSIWMLTASNRTSLRLSPEGLDFSGFGVGPIAWRGIRSVKLQAVGRFQMIALELVNEKSYLAQRRKSRWKNLEHFLFRSSFAFAPPTAVVKPEAIMAAIQLRMKTFGRDSQ